MSDLNKKKTNSEDVEKKNSPPKRFWKAKTPHKYPQDLDPGDYISVERSPIGKKNNGEMDQVVCKITHNSNGMIRLHIITHIESKAVCLSYDEIESPKRKYMYLGKKKDFLYRLSNLDFSSYPYYFPEIEEENK